MIEREGDTLRVAGSLTKETVEELYGADMQPVDGSELLIDFTKVEAVDSAAVSLLLTWLRDAREKKITLRFSNVPKNLISLARLYGVLDQLPVAE